MKKTILSALAACALTISATASASYQYGTVTEFIVTPDRATFQLDTTDGADMREGCLDPAKPLNFVIDFADLGGKAMYEVVYDARKNGTKLGINGDGTCIGDEFEKADSIAPAWVPTT